MVQWQGTIAPLRTTGDGSLLLTLGVLLLYCCSNLDIKKKKTAIDIMVVAQLVDGDNLHLEGSRVFEFESLLWQIKLKN